MTEHDTRVQNLIDEAKRLRYSLRQVFRSGAALGLSAAGIQAALRGSGHAIAAPRQTRYQTGGSLTINGGNLGATNSNTAQGGAGGVGRSSLGGYTSVGYRTGGGGAARGGGGDGRPASRQSDS